MIYLVKMTPLEPYSFGGDQNFKYKDEALTGKESYFVRSKEMPEQTSILGMLRYLVLQQEGLLKTNFTYSDTERKQMEKCIGPASFSYAKTEPQNFGIIKEVSPVFVTNKEGNVIVKNPFHNKASEKGYDPMIMGEETETSYGKISLPEKGEYNAKEWHAYGYINIDTGEIEGSLFETKTVVGNRKSNSKEERKEGFFKREMKVLKEGHSFAVYVQAEKLPEKSMVYMGKKKSAFLVETEEKVSDELETKVKNFFSAGKTWYYALSDIVIQEPIKYRQFSIVEEKHQRNLRTVRDTGDRLSRKKSKERYHLIESGSVFYIEEPSIVENKNATQIGYNRIVKLGGE